MNERELLKNLTKHDPDALSAVIDQYARYVTTIVHQIIGSVMSDSDTEEVVSDVFFALWNQAGQVKPGHLKGFLSRIARNKAINKLRQQGLALPLEEDELIPGGHEPERLLLAEEQHRILQQALLSMGQPDREIFLRHYYYCQSVSTIGAEMELNISTIKSKLARGRRKLKQILQEGGYCNED